MAVGAAFDGGAVGVAFGGGAAGGGRGGGQIGRKTPSILLCFRCEASLDQLSYLPKPCLPTSNVMRLSQTFFESASQTVI